MMVNLYHMTHFTHLGKYTTELRVFCQMVMGLCNKPIKPPFWAFNVCSYLLMCFCYEVLYNGLHKAIRLAINRFYHWCTNWKTFWARKFQTMTFFFSLVPNQSHCHLLLTTTKRFFGTNRCVNTSTYSSDAKFCRIRSVGLVHVFTCSRGPDVKHLHSV